MTGTCTLDSYALKVQESSFREVTSFCGVDKYVWSGAAIGLQHKSYGSVESWTFTAFEDAELVAWVDSPAFHLLGHVADGAAVTFVFDAAGKHSVPTNQGIYVESVKVTYSSNLKTRYYDLTLRAT